MAAGTGTQKELCVQIVDLQPGDLPAVRALELECFSDAWSEKLLQDLLTSSWDKVWVLKEDETVCGYSNFRVIAGEGELMRIAVHGACRGRGYGRLLMERLLSVMKLVLSVFVCTPYDTLMLHARLNAAYNLKFYSNY